MLLTVLSSVALGCAPKKIDLAEVPDKPIVETCFINLDLGGLDCKTIANVYYTRPFQHSDKFICHSPDEWEKIAKYNIEMRKVVRRSCVCN